MSETPEDRLACGMGREHAPNVVRFRPREDRDAFIGIVLDGVFVSTPRGPALTVRIRYRTRHRAWTSPVFSAIGQMSGHVHSEIPALRLSAQQVREITKLLDACAELASPASTSSGCLDELQSTLLGLLEGRASAIVSDEVLSKLHCKVLRFRREDRLDSRCTS